MSEESKSNTDKTMQSQEQKQLPVTLISGFLGAGKSTLLRNILEGKKGDKDFRCAVLVNDMAELNIDKALIESSGLVRSDEVISMQNGCVCCNLSGELIEQIVSLSMNRETPFDYLIIEASGVSEPAAIAALFEECKDDRDHSEHEHAGKTSLFEVARMDTIVTVVDSAEFLQNLDLMDDPDKKNYPRLLVDQVEYSNVVLLNKTDLVSESQLQEVKDKVALLTAGKETKILTTENSTIDVKDVVDTKLYNSKDFDLSKFIQSFETFDVNKSCCKASVAKGESPCCKRARTIDSGKSQVLLPSKKIKKTRHGENYNITSFVYKARRPFLPQNLYENFIDKFFMSEEDPKEEEEYDEEEATEGEPMKKKSKIGGDDDESDTSAETKKSTEAETQAQLEAIQKMQEEGAMKKKVRTETIGSVLRVKGYMWQGNSHDLIGYISTAGNLSRIESPGRWACLDESSYRGTSKEHQEQIRKNWVAPYGDRRQELVFIGQDLKHETIQKILDDCLLTDETMALGADGWKAIMGDIMLDD
jgi:G3E family GTPase